MNVLLQLAIGLRNCRSISSNKMSTFPFLLLLTVGLVSGTSNRSMSSLLFDITKEAMDLLPSLRQTSRSGDESDTVASSALKRLNSILVSIRGGSNDRYNIFKVAENRESKGLMGRISDTLQPLLAPLKIVTTHVAGNNSRLATALKEEEKN